MKGKNRLSKEDFSKLVTKIGSLAIDDKKKSEVLDALRREYNSNKVHSVLNYV